jgi:hypothetical protein
MVLAYLLSVVASLTVLAVTLLRCHPAPTPPQAPAPAPAAVLPAGADAEIRVILAAATQLAARLGAAA